MSDEEMSHALDHIMRDSYLWSECAMKLKEFAALADALPVNGGQFSYLADRAGVTETYNNLRGEMVRLLEEGNRAQQDVSERLYVVAKRYEGDAEDAKDRMRKIERKIEEGN